METNLTEIEQKPTKKRSKTPILIASLAGVLVLAGLGTGYAKFDLFKSPKAIYLEAEATNIQELSANISKGEDWFAKEVKPYVEQPVHSTMEISNITVNGEIPDPQAKQVLDLLKEVTFLVDSSVDQQKQQQYSKINLHVKGQNLIGLEVFLDKSKMGLGVPDLYKKYGYMDLQDRDILKEKYQMEKLPKRLVTSKDIINAIKPNKDEFSAIVNDYGKLYIESISDSQVTLNKNSTFEQDGYKVSTRELTITFTKDDVKVLATKLADKAIKDEKLFDLFYTRYKNLVTVLKDSGYPDIEEKSRDELKSEFTKGLEDFKKNVDTYDSKDGIVMVLQIDGNDSVISRKFRPLVPKPGQENAELASSTWKNNGESNYLFTMNSGSIDGKKDEIKISYKAKEQGNESKGTVGYFFKTSADNKVKSLFDFSTQFTVNKDGNTEKGNYDFKVNTENETEGKVAFSGNVASTMQKDGKKRNQDTTFKLAFDQKTAGMPEGFSVHVKSSDELVSEIKLPQLTDENSFNIAKLTDEQMMQLQQEIGVAAQQFMMKNMSLFQSLGIIPPQ